MATSFVDRSYRLSDKRPVDPTPITIDDDDDDIETEQIIRKADKETDPSAFLNRSIDKLDIDSELIFVKSNVPTTIYTTALSYPKLHQIHLLIVKNLSLSKPECIPKRNLYMGKPCLSSSIPRRTRVYHRSLCLLGFILESSSLEKNRNRYLVLYDNYSAHYHQATDLHLCLCQDFSRHMKNLDFNELRLYYEHVFQHSEQTPGIHLVRDNVIRVRRFGPQYHNVRIVDRDGPLMKICFFERKSQSEMWIHCQSSMIEPYSPLLSYSLERSSSSSSSSSSPSSLIDDNSNETNGSDGDLSRLRKRNSPINNDNEGRKKLRDRSNTKPSSSPVVQEVQLPSSSPSGNDDVPLSSRANMLNAYYTSILLPKFRVLNSLPYTEHKCSQLCVDFAEERFSANKIDINPFLLPFQCKWSIIEGKPRGYRTPCRRTFYSLDDIERYLYQTESKLSIKFFIDDLVTRFTPSSEEYDRKFILIDDLSNGQEHVRTSVYNDIDSDRPEHFTYIKQVRPFDHRIQAALYDTNMTSCCDCTDNCSNRMKCACFRKTLDQALVNHDPLVLEKQRNRYTLAHILKTMAYQRKRLLNPVSSGIYECNSKCSCHQNHCSNRLLQQGLFVQLQLFKDKQKGWGLRALHDLPRGTFICQYVGELLTSDQGHERAQTIDDKYQTSLDLVRQIRYDVEDDEDIDDDDDDEEPYVIDGSLFSNLGKYFNHSCDPNMYIQNVFIESHDLHFPNLALFTRTHIKAGQELTWHYNCELLPDRQVKCLCGSKHCRGRLF